MCSVSRKTMNTLQNAIKRFSEIQSESDIFFKKFLNAAQKNTSRKCISRGILYNLRPYQAQRSGFQPGKEIKFTPKSTKNIYVYYFDRGDRVVLIEIYGQSEKIINREFYFYDEESIESVYFDSDGYIRNMTLSALSGGKFIQDINIGTYGISIYSYKYTGDLLSFIFVNQKENEQEKSSTFQMLFEYSGEKLSRIISVFSNGYKEQNFP